TRRRDRGRDLREDREPLVTTALPQTRPHGRAVQYDDDQTLARPPAGRRSGPRGGWFARRPDWPIAALLVGWPLWWLLGIISFAPALLAIPMAWRLYRWRATGTRVIRTPPRFGIWLLFLVVMVAGLTTISLTAPGTLSS